MAVSITRTIRQWTANGEPWIWVCASALAICMCAVAGVLVLIGTKGFQHFWPNELVEITHYAANSKPTRLIGEVVETDELTRSQFLEAGGIPARPDASQETVTRILIKSGNRRIAPPDFRWVFVHDIISTATPTDLAVISRVEWGNAYGRILELSFTNPNSSEQHTTVAGSDLRPILESTLERLNNIRDTIDELEHGTIFRISEDLEALRLERRRIELEAGPAAAAEIAQLEARERILLATYREQEITLNGLLQSLSGSQLHMQLADGSTHVLELADITRVRFPNEMSTLQRLGVFFVDVARFLTDEPREANTEGGVFPAIFGTVLMVLLMSIVVTPIGVITAIYLHEYAHKGPLVGALRIAITNLAGVPSIVYGVFGLGFFVYFLGGNIDRLFFPEALPAPTFGTPGLFWASLTLALLTVPVVIVSTEEGLARIPQSLREGSLALGATKAETLMEVILPAASPAILTGVILAVARAAGEVAPLMLVGVVKLAPALPIDGEFPFLHLERKFMHLGFHIYDVGFQSPNVEAARPIVYATALLLITLIVGLNLTAITLRNQLEQRYKSLE